ncbi:hypothetical protein [Luteimonas chenhongjianii]|uniref:hypothetical protein n=1 Tax=Luteimonas chenhongjianii TaxID=2006110 RepID=UPI001FE9DAF0|nr:hypothetical protein [Luteimonas chenhongjianii]
MTLTYTADQLTREAQLLATEIALLADFVIGEEAGVRALGLAADSEFAQSRHPDDLAEITGMALFGHVRRVESYVRDQEWAPEIPVDVSALQLAVDRTFSPAVLHGYEMEREAHGERDVLGAHEVGAGDLPFGYFHRGILADLVARAAARLKVDRGERLTMADIALLLDVREPTVITNAHRKNFPTVEDENRRYAEPGDALPWMLKQGYVPTKGLPGESDTAHQTEPVGDLDDVVFVPVARDGSWFGPDCRVSGRFTIGAKEAEEKHKDYFTALEALVRMPTPRWRRPNGNGVPGIVAGVRFDRMRRADLRRALS